MQCIIVMHFMNILHLLCACVHKCEFVNACDSVRNCLRVCVMHNIKFVKVKNEPPFGESWLRA